MAATSQSAIAVIGIDIGKNSFHVVGLDGRGAIVLRSLQVGPRPLVHNRPLFINTDSKFGALGFVAMGQ
jgi:hypothetical protein